MRKLFFLLFIFIFFEKMNAQDLVYRAKNPAFGGETFNYQWLQSNADAQNTFKDPNAKTSSSTTQANPLDEFTRTLNRTLLSQISSRLITAQFGENGLQPGQYTIGNFDINVGNSADGVVIDVTDFTTGQATQIVVPFF
jgi:curli production assembly/transport component CsgF